jgi:hypothetical protein
MFGRASMHRGVRTVALFAVSGIYLVTLIWPICSHRWYCISIEATGQNSTHMECYNSTF